jgi:hypothetical protein
MVQLKLDYILSGQLLVTSPPPLDYYIQARESFGIQAVPDVFHHFYDGVTPAAAYVLNTKCDKLLMLINKSMR